MKEAGDEYGREKKTKNGSGDSANNGTRQTHKRAVIITPTDKTTNETNKGRYCDYHFSSSVSYPVP